ncbi:MAG: hypothetical protein AAF918_12900 [Pseudomonadota bacterium]
MIGRANPRKTFRNRRHWVVAVILCGVSLSAHADYGYRRTGWSQSEPQLREDGAQVPGGCPIESPAGRFLWTARNPGSGLDIYVNERTANGKSFAIGGPLPEPINDPGLANDFCPTPQPDGELYYVSARDGGCGSADLQVAINNPAGGWAEPVNLGCAPEGPNTPGLELSPAIVKTVWGTFLYFSTDYYSGNQDIYRSRMRSDGTFGPGKRLPWPINTEYDDRQPNLSRDGRELVFASNRPTTAGDDTGFDIFQAKRRHLFFPWRRVVNLSETVPFETVDSSETRPSLSWDGKRLHYGAGGVWVSKRARSFRRW